MAELPYEWESNEELCSRLHALADLRGSRIAFGSSWATYLATLTTDELLDLKLAIRRQLAQLGAA